MINRGSEEFNNIGMLVKKSTNNVIELQVANTSAAADCLVNLWSKQGGEYFCLATRRKEKKDGGLEPHWFKQDRFKWLKERIDSLVDSHNVWFCPHGFRKKVRQAEYAVLSSFVYADCDEVDPRNAKVAPTVVIESSPGRYVGLWRVKDALVPEEVNQAWTYANGYDKGGWDPTQVLRLPGLPNYKYDPTPISRLIEFNDNGYSLKRFKKAVPKKPVGRPLGNGATYRKWEKTIPQWLRAEMLEGSVPDRSIWLWKAQKMMLGRGIPRADIFKILWNCRHNKYRDRTGGKKQLRKELRKSQDIMLGSQETSSGVVLEPINREGTANMTWLWENYIPEGALTVISGDPGTMKTQITMSIAATVATGGTWPDGTDCDHKGKILILSSEDPTRQAIGPRYVAAGGPDGTMQRIRTVMGEDGKSRQFNLKNDLHRLNDIDVKLIIIDSLDSYLPGIDSHKSASVREALTPMAEWAEANNVTVIGILHWNKGNSPKAIMRTNGSTAYNGVARASFSTMVDPDDPEHFLFLPAKTNYAPRGLKGFGLTVREFEYHSGKESVKTTKAVWGDEIERTADGILGGDVEIESRMEKCCVWLTQRLGAAPANIDDLLEEAQPIAGKDTLRRALRKVAETKKLGKGRWVWKLKNDN